MKRRVAMALALVLLQTMFAACLPASGMRNAFRDRPAATSATDPAVTLALAQTPFVSPSPSPSLTSGFNPPWWQQRNRELEASMRRYRPHATKERIEKDLARMTLDPDKPMVALSFDDGPMAGVTDQILTILQQYNARATFFVCGWRLSQPKNQEMLRRMAALGCEIGNHTWSHAGLSDLNYIDSKREIENTNKAVFDATGVLPRCFRPPGGVNGFDTGRVTRENGMYIVLWSQSGNVHEFDPKRIAQNVEKQIVDGKELHAGDVILLHDTHDCMVDAVKIIVPKLIREGYQLVTVWELLNCSGETLVPGQVYQPW